MTAGMALRIAIVSATVSSSWAASITDLTPQGFTTSWATGINNNGQAVGYARGVTQEHAFLYSNGNSQDLGLGPGTFSSQAVGINESGTVVGYSDTPRPGGGTRIYYGWTYANGTFSDVATPTGRGQTDLNIPLGIGNSGDVVGYYAVGVESHYVSSGGTARELTGLALAPLSINAGGVVASTAAFSSAADPSGYHAYLFFSGGGTRDIGTLGGADSLAWAINDSGQVVGWADTNGAANPHPFLYSGGTMQDLGTLGSGYGTAKAISPNGLVVGDSGDARYSPLAFLWYQGGVITDLNTFLPENSGWRLTEATGINNAGQIVGNGIIGGQQHAFLLDLNGQSAAAPEPASWTLGIAALSLMLSARKKRSQRNEAGPSV